MRKYILIMLLLSATQMKGQGLKLASDVWPPFTNKVQEVHFAQDLVLEALKRNNRSAEVSIIEFKDVSIGIYEEKFDGSAAMWKNEERAALLLFSEPYLQNRLVLVARKGSPVYYSALAELRGKKLAIVESYDYGPQLTNLKTITLAKTSSDQESLNMLLAGKVDYILLMDQLFHF